MNRIEIWLRGLFRWYQEETQTFVDEMLRLAFDNVKEDVFEKLTPEVKAKVRRKVLADVHSMKLDLDTIKGKSESGKIIMDAIAWFVSEAADSK